MRSLRNEDLVAFPVSVIYQWVDINGSILRQVVENVCRGNWTRVAHGDCQSSPHNIDAVCNPVLELVNTLVLGEDEYVDPHKRLNGGIGKTHEFQLADKMRLVIK